MEAYFRRKEALVRAETGAAKNINLAAQVSGKKAEIIKNGLNEKMKLQIFNFRKITTQNECFYNLFFLFKSEHSLVLTFFRIFLKWTPTP